MNRHLLVLTFVSLLACGTSAQAGLISFTSQMVPDFELTLNPVLIGSSGPVTVPGQANGSLNFVFDLDTSAQTLDFVSVDGVFQGMLADPGMTPFKLFATGLDTGSASNVSVAGGVLTNADLTFSLNFEMLATGGPLAGVILEPNTSLEFSGNISALPFPVGTIFAGPTTPPNAPEPGIARIGPMVIPDAVSVQNRTLTTVPEPGSFAIFAVGLLGTLGFRRRQSKLA